MSIVNYNNDRRREKLTETIVKYLELMSASGKSVGSIQLHQKDCDLLGGNFRGIKLEGIEGDKR